MEFWKYGIKFSQHIANVIFLFEMCIGSAKKKIAWQKAIVAEDEQFIARTNNKPDNIQVLVTKEKLANQLDGNLMSSLKMCSLISII